MEEFFPGQHVVCIDDGPTPDAPHSLVKGKEYVIRDVGLYWFRSPMQYIPGVRLVGVVRIHIMDPDCPFGGERFRPVDTKSIEVFRKIARDITNGAKKTVKSL